jgi:hypothetical protein
MNNENKIEVCDICGSDQIEIVRKITSLKVPFGPDATYEKVISSCKNCREEMDITNDDDRIKAIALSEKNSLVAVINFIVSQGYSLADVERALDLPTRTISRWKSGQEPSAAGLTLLRFIRLFPWLIQVAENNYDETFSRSILLHEAVSEFFKIQRYISDDSDKSSIYLDVMQNDSGCQFVAVGSSSIPATKNTGNIGNMEFKNYLLEKV